MKKNFLCLSLVIVALMGCSKKSEEGIVSDPIATVANEVTVTDEQFKSLGIVIGKPEQRSVSDQINANGMLDVPPQNLVTISAPLGGFVKKTELLQGMKVSKGQTIVVMEHPDYIQLQEDYLTTKGQLEFLELEYKRQEELAKENVNAAKALQQAKSNYFGAKARMQGLKAKLILSNINPAEIENGEIKSTISIPAPISGFVSQVNVNIGMHVSPTDIMFRIVDTDHLHAEAQVFEKDIPQLKIGQRVFVRLSNETQEREAKVFLIGKEITPERTVRVHCHLEKKDDSLIPGLFFSARIETNNKLVTTLPSEAVVAFENKNYVFVQSEQKPYKYKMMAIDIGETEKGFTEVMIPETIKSAKIVLKGSYYLLGILKNTEE